ncbi:hypothetical protein [Nocardia sp. NPDC050710]|uniref:hypothetical protein n=1 Tax=Nocardia sp. NPDC050710 TaxID=3157220 RepID=UPI0033D3FCA0
MWYTISNSGRDSLPSGKDPARRAYPDRELHMVMDKLRRPQVYRDPQAAGRKPLTQVHFTPNSASWTDLVEVWFGIIERQAIHRDARELATTLRTFIKPMETPAPSPAHEDRIANERAASAGSVRTVKSGSAHPGAPHASSLPAT